MLQLHQEQSVCCLRRENSSTTMPYFKKIAGQITSKCCMTKRIRPYCHTGGGGINAYCPLAPTGSRKLRFYGASKDECTQIKDVRQNNRSNSLDLKPYMRSSASDNLSTSPFHLAPVTNGTGSASIRGQSLDISLCQPNTFVLQKDLTGGGQRGRKTQPY